jgi:hypothetical protein
MYEIDLLVQNFNVERNLWLASWDSGTGEKSVINSLVNSHETMIQMFIS